MKRSLLFAVAALFGFACAGPAGMTGPPGPTGMTGPQGPAGVTGAQGSTGSQGSTGMTGSQGSAGVTGAQGPAGVATARNPYPGWAALRDFTFDYDRTDIRSSELNQPSEDRGLCAAEPVRASRDRRVHGSPLRHQSVHFGAEPAPYRHRP